MLAVVGGVGVSGAVFHGRVKLEIFENSGLALRLFLFLFLFLARAKRERVVQDEVAKANRRPTDPRPDPTRHGTPKD